jgi:hypothetical protein
MDIQIKMVLLGQTSSREISSLMDLFKEIVIQTMKFKENLSFTEKLPLSILSTHQQTRHIQI